MYCTEQGLVHWYEPKLSALVWGSYAGLIVSTQHYEILGLHEYIKDSVQLTKFKFAVLLWSETNNYLTIIYLLIICKVALMT